MKDRRQHAADVAARSAHVQAQQAAEEEPEILDADSFYDHERMAIARVWSTLEEKHRGRSVEGSAFQREVRERFAEIGFVVRCDLYRDPDDPRDWDDRPWMPQISFVGRCEPMNIGDFDHERQGHEVRSNILGVRGQQGETQKTQVAPGWSKSGSGLIVPGS